MTTDDAIKALEKGAYVLATKWSDGDPYDHWCVGFYDRMDSDRHYVVDGNGKQFRLNGFRRVAEISPEYGEFLVKNKDHMQGGIGSLWDGEETIRTALQLLRQTAPVTLPAGIFDRPVQEKPRLRRLLTGPSVLDAARCETCNDTGSFMNCFDNEIQCPCKSKDLCANSDNRNLCVVSDKERRGWQPIEKWTDSESCGKEVLVSWDNGSVEQMHWAAVEGYTKPKIHSGHVITHWMPLPEPPINEAISTDNRLTSDWSFDGGDSFKIK